MCAYKHFYAMCYSYNLWAVSTTPIFCGVQVIAYMMKEYQMPLADAKKHVKTIRGCINPNDGFLSQLRSYEGILTARYALVYRSLHM